MRSSGLLGPELPGVPPNVVFLHTLELSGFRTTLLITKNHIRELMNMRLDEKKGMGLVPHRNYIQTPQCSKSSKMRLFTKSASILALGSLATWSLAGPLLNSAHHHARDQYLPAGMSLAEKEHVIISSFSNVSISEWSYYYTHGPHLAGKNYSQAEWTRDKWSESGVPSTIASYNVFLNYPVSHALSLSYPNGSVFNATLEEDVLPEDDTSGYPDRISTFHGYSFTGKATAEYVYAGQGRKIDFQRLDDLGVSLKGKIALVKYGGPFRGLKVKNSQDYGMIGTVIFTDPGDDGDMNEGNGFAAYPDGPARNPSSVQRGSVEFLSIYPGDPTTPGYPSKPGVPRQDTSPVVPHIPSLPISFKEARPLLEALNGKGFSAADVNITNWVGGLQGVSYSTGPAPNAVLSIDNVMDDQITDIWNTIGIINGTIEDEVIVIGNHRDAWIVGGASDPNSGSAVLIELAKAFGKLVEKGWKPRRTIVLASWDAEEYGLVGSTEWFEEYVSWAVPNMVAYLNVDVAVAGSNWGVAAVPELHDIIREVMKKIPAANNSSKTIYDDWAVNTGGFGVLGSGSDYTAFIHHSGIASMDMGFGPSARDPVYHYHSNYDSFHWMSTYGDPTWNYHVAAGQFLGVLALNLAEQLLLPLNVSTYTQELWSYFEDLTTTVESSSLKLELEPVNHAIKAFGRIADKLMQLVEKLDGHDDHHDHWKYKAINNRLRMFEKGFVSQGGLPTREFYQHLIYAPGLDTGYAPVTFPGITEAVEGGDLKTAEEFVEKTARAIWHATAILALGKWHGEDVDYSELSFEETVV